MSCVSQILSGLLDECETSKGGIKKIWISAEDPKPITESGMISDFNYVVDWYEYNFKKNTSSFTSNYTIDNTNGVNYVTTDLVLQVNKMSTVKRIEMANLAINEIYIIVLDANNKYWYLGYDEPVTATTGGAQTGTVKTDGNFYQITFTDESKSLPLEIDEEAIKNLYKNNPLKFTAIQESSISIDFSEEYPIILYATKDFNEIETITSTGWSTTLNEGESIYIYGENPGGLYNIMDDYPMTFNISGLVDLSGNIMSLIGEEATEIPGDYCFSYMFQECDIRTAPQLPAKKLTTGCYLNMFYGCTNLINAPELPATEVAENCYCAMFSYCDNLKTSPKILPAKILAEQCYYGMFEDCTSLTSAPMLPATTLADTCYKDMFKNCEKLTSGPELPAKTMQYECYASMFENCYALVNAPALPATNLSGECYEYMFKNCSSLVKAPTLPAMKVEIMCYQGMFQGCSSLVNVPALPAMQLDESCYYGMFIGCRNLTKAQDVLPALNLANSCYLGMFNTCMSLTKAPALPAVVLAPACYQGMFIQCIKLKEAPALPATELSEGCYSHMFSTCPELVSAPALPATELKSRCYSAMFNDCNNLENAPILPATTLTEECYSTMFRGCNKLNYIEMHAEQLGSQSLFNWLSGVAVNGTIKKKASLNLPSGPSGVPTNWTVEAI